jgi:hypothetical protein
MIKPLRNYHFLLWHILAVLLPLVFVAALMVRPSLPERLSIPKETFEAKRMTLSDSTSMILITVNRPLTVPSCLLFNVSGKKEILLGKLDHQGPYRFIVATPDKIITLKFFDAIHQRTITSLTLNE